jgi:hypothetical protein
MKFLLDQDVYAVTALFLRALTHDSGRDRWFPGH